MNPDQDYKSIVNDMLETDSEKSVKWHSKVFKINKHMLNIFNVFSLDILYITSYLLAGKQCVNEELVG